MYIMMTSLNGNIFRVTGPLCGEFTGPGEFPPQRPVTRSFDVFFDLRLNKRLSKQSWGWWFETLSCPLWRHGNVMCVSRDTWFCRLSKRWQSLWRRLYYPFIDTIHTGSPLGYLHGRTCYRDVDPFSIHLSMASLCWTLFGTEKGGMNVY